MSVFKIVPDVKSIGKCCLKLFSRDIKFLIFLLLDVFSGEDQLGKLLNYSIEYCDEFLDALKTMLETNPQKLTELASLENITDVFCDSEKFEQYLTLSETVPLDEIQALFCSGLNFTSLGEEVMLDMSFLWEVMLIFIEYTNY